MEQLNLNPRIITTPKSSSPPKDIEFSMLGQPPSTMTNPEEDAHVNLEENSGQLLAKIWGKANDEDFADIILQDGLDTKDGLLMKGERHDVMLRPVR